jgi:site-specific DNA-cytosine methylase
MVMARFKELGYRAQLFLLNAADCGVPQRRERVFFCALRNDINAPLLKLAPRHPWVSAGEACDDLAVLTKEEAGEVAATEMHLQWWHLTKKGDSYGTAAKAAGRTGLFSHVRLNDMQPAPTLTCATGDHSALHWDECAV